MRSATEAPPDRRMYRAGDARGALARGRRLRQRTAATERACMVVPRPIGVLNRLATASNVRRRRMALADLWTEGRFSGLGHGAARLLTARRKHMMDYGRCAHPGILSSAGPTSIDAAFGGEGAARRERSCSSVEIPLGGLLRAARPTETSRAHARNARRRVRSCGAECFCARPKARLTGVLIDIGAPSPIRSCWRARFGLNTRTRSDYRACRSG